MLALPAWNIKNDVPNHLEIPAWSDIPNIRRHLQGEHEDTPRNESSAHQTTRALESSVDIGKLLLPSFERRILMKSRKCLPRIRMLRLRIAKSATRHLTSPARFLSSEKEESPKHLVVKRASPMQRSTLDAAGNESRRPVHPRRAKAVASPSRSGPYVLDNESRSHTLCCRMERFCRCASSIPCRAHFEHRAVCWSFCPT